MIFFRMIIGVDNCFFYFFYFDKYEGVIIFFDFLLGLVEIG